MIRILEDIYNSMVEIDIGRVRDLVREALRQGVATQTILDEGLARGLKAVGERYEAREYFLSELLGAGTAMQAAMEELAPSLQKEGPRRHLGRIVLGTVKNDIHDIGKNIVKMLMTGEGFEVFDLGVDVPPEKFVEKARETNADIVAMSALLTTTMLEMVVVVKELEKSSLRKKVRVIIGGGAITPEFARQIGADAAGMDAAHGVRLCREWMEGKA